ncbi:MAG: hypothetical protein HC924_00460 [Synechococcaceae cyanobacterium SM2_3_2]|nr:hypothetical protein [Synechococcaceae cyanobacterium SM2_3_2]
MAQKEGDFLGGFVIGAVVGGIVGGVIGAALVPRLLKRGSHKVAGERTDPWQQTQSPTPEKNTSRRVSARLQAADDVAIAQARKTLEEKIAQLNEAIQDTRAQLLVQDSQPR